MLKYPGAHPMSAPVWSSTIINTTNNELVSDQKKISKIVKQVVTITGQQPYVKKSKTSHSAFSIRKGIARGVLVTLHKKARDDFFFKLIQTIIPKNKTWHLNKVTTAKNPAYNIGFGSLMDWFELRLAESTGLHVQLGISGTNKDWINFFLSFYKLKINLKNKIVN